MIYTIYIVYSSGVSGCACLNEQQSLAVVNALIFPVWLYKKCSRNASMPANTLDFGLDILKSRNLLQKMTAEPSIEKFLQKLLAQCLSATAHPRLWGFLSMYVCMCVGGWVCARARMCVRVCANAYPRF